MNFVEAARIYSCVRAGSRRAAATFD